MADLRTLYLTRGLSIGGRSHFVGRKLYDALAADSEASLVGHFVMKPDDDEISVDPRMADDAVRFATLREFEPSLIYLEGGLRPNASGHWRFPEPLLRDVVARGAVVIVADVDYGVFQLGGRRVYDAAADFLGARAQFLDDDDSSFPVYAIDLVSNWGSPRELVLRPDEMHISRWLEPVYEGIERIVVGSPVKLNPYEDILASGNRGTTGTLCNDVWVNEIDFAPLASVKTLGAGYVVCVAGAVSLDAFVEAFPSNASWVLSVTQFLLAESAREAERRLPLRELQSAVVAARARARLVDDAEEAGDAFSTELDPALREHAVVLEKRRRARAARAELEARFGVAWRNLTPEAVQYLVAAEVLRLELDDYRSLEPGFDFSASVAMYSKAVETLLSDKIFLPFRDRSGASTVDTAARDDATRRSVAQLRGFVRGRPLTLGQMAYVLRTVGCQRDNVFAEHLRTSLNNDAEFCARDGFPERLLTYVREFRNGAAHTESLPLERAISARAFLLEEPVKLLVSLASQVGASA